MMLPSYLQFAIRKRVLVVFIVLLIIATYLGFAPVLPIPVNDKLCHFVVFFLLSLVFYWVFDLSRRRATQLTLVVCGLVGCVGSEFVQAFLTLRTFDVFDILANLVGCGLSLMINVMYHKRRLEKLHFQRYGRLDSAEDDLELQARESEDADGVNANRSA
ncbi:Golgi multispanning membrane VanZ-like family protein [Schizosaccharomyces osmophilus]|uniref:Golgi multispanning membrane VanZ-like family protein n=1 Tax=Schizosaccharomyces osmophilus TaxID=2545709 RepID=A0AAF0AWV4_9SCHI|nr:Golgi multispanning membrane VanZ-like family protein [Schizosaccharomyces osmophilus]WBW73430.1 Golgi multispanning membrane VanZ-like family protein [Schizosaccharomyces osmophilus]